MKKIFFAVAFLTYSIIVEGQAGYQATTVKTPTGVDINARIFTGEDFHEDEYATIIFNYTHIYNVEVIGNPTRFYNCHGYAWHNFEGNMAQSDLRWINDVDESTLQHNFNVNKYYSGNNPAYKEVAYNNKAWIKVSYDPRDHSAITSTIYGYFISKWNDGPLVRHLPEQCPFYSNAQIKYYELNPPNMTGSTSLLCYNVEREFITNITDMPKATLTWTPGSYVIPVRGAGTPKYTVKGSSGNGSTYVNLKITTPSGFTWTSPNINFWVGKPLMTNQKVDGGSYYSGKPICPGNHWLSVTPVGDGAGNATWTVPSGILYFVGNNTLDFTFPSSFGSVSITARSANSCGTGPNAAFYLTKKTSGCTLSVGITVYPNPTSDNITITMMEDQPLVNKFDTSLVNLSVDNVTAGEPTTYTINIYNNQSILVSSFTRRDKSFTIPLNNIQDGTYIIDVCDGMNSYRQQLIVKH